MIVASGLKDSTLTDMPSTLSPSESYTAFCSMNMIANEFGNSLDLNGTFITSLLTR